MSVTKRDSFSGKFGVIAAAAGSAVGLGNIWKFPYITGEYGGAAFMFVYLGFILVIGLPVMISEFIVGRTAKRNAFGAFRKLAPKSAWYVTGFFGVGAAYLILSFYGVVAGWAMNYVLESANGVFTGMDAAQISDHFNHFSSGSVKPVLWQLAFMILTAVIVLLGVHKGIERFSKFLMPLLVVILIILVFRSVTLPGAMKGIKFFLYPDFTKLTWHGVLNALGHAFFSLSLGMGTLITYGSYIDDNNNLAKTAVQVTMADTIIAILAGLAILPAVFAFNLEPDAGAGLVFKTLPNVFLQMPGGVIFSVLFFVLLTIAALTSSISILEVVVAFLSEELKIGRTIATILATVTIAFVGVICSLSLGMLNTEVFLGLNFFDTLDFFASNIFLPFGGALIAVFIGWRYGIKKVHKALASSDNENIWYLNLMFYSLKYVAPIAILIVSAYGIIEQVATYLNK
nr:sodium-dependent transporter [uncultured Carboxylicivirga sp.]